MANSQTQLKDYLLVAAIDFGTTYSGYAFSTKGEFMKDPLKIHANQAWVSGGKYLLSLKTPTCLLLDKREKFVSFGFDAENKYADLVMDGKQREYFYFHRFKMRLHAQTLTKDMILEDILGKPLPALKVFSLSIKALKQHLMDTLKTQGTGIRPEEIQWVLTVPAIWTDPAKQFMRESAKEAGIPSEQLKLALEPEAASIFCQHLPVERMPGASKGFSVSRSGTKYMVIDLGGGTADITLHEKVDGAKLKELYKASGGACGGTAVDSQFFQLLAKIVGAPLLKKMERQHTSAYIDLFRDFETVKRTVKPETEGKVNMTIPIVTLNPLCEKMLGEDFKSALSNSTFSDKIAVLGDKLRTEAPVMKEIFKQAIGDIISHIETIMTKPEARGVSMFLLVGGFSESALVQAAIRKAFPHMKIIIPDEPGLAVLRGAVIFGHIPDSISSRIMKCTYGVAVTAPFVRGKHRNDQKVIISGKEHCTNVFSPFMEAGTSVPVGTKVVKTYNTIRPYQDGMIVKVFHSEESSPEYTTDDSCQLLGQVEIDVPNPTEDEHILVVQYTFGDTELSLIAVESDSMTVCTSNFNML